MSAPSDRSSHQAVRIGVDRVACTGHGVCAMLLPRQVRLDEWGYPVLLDDRAAPEEADAAVRWCPSRALYRR